LSQNKILGPKSARHIFAASVTRGRRPYGFALPPQKCDAYPGLNSLLKQKKFVYYSNIGRVFARIGALSFSDVSGPADIRKKLQNQDVA
jgi:hypothetical protein